MSEAGRRPPSFVVGIGASAGGLEALVELLGALPATGMAFIVVQHLDPTHESLLSEILTKKTKMAVSLATAGEEVQRDHVYVIPPDALLTVHEGLIEVKRRPSAPERWFPVDLLFSSLAAAYGASAIGVVLSGGDADGSLGLRAIKDAGGFTFAQHPDSARFPTMPTYAIETGCVDFTLRPKAIARELERLSRRFSTEGASAGSASRSTIDRGTDEDAVRRARRVMIVDDHAELRASVSRVVRSFGHEVVVATDGSTALSLAETFQPECAIVDLSMPGMNGIELGRRLRQRFPPAQLRLIALSGYAGADLRDACLAEGFDAYLIKPGDIRELEREIGGDRADSDASEH